MAIKLQKNCPESVPSASRTRFMLLVLVVLCLMINWANILAFNFTIICMHPKDAGNGSFVGQSNSSSSTNSTAEDDSNADDYLTREFSNYEKSQAMGVVAAGALVTNIPIITVINWYGPRYLFTVVGLFGALATALIPYAMRLGWAWFLTARVLQGMAFAGDMATFGHFVTYWTYHKQYAFFTATLCVYVQVAPIFTNPVSGIICESAVGWPGVYYFHSAVTFVLFILFFLCYRNDPNEHPFVNELEKEKIARGRGDTLDKQAHKFVPYMDILKSPAAWAVFIGGIGNFVGINLLYQFTPTYLYKVQGFEVVKVGFMAALPAVGQACVKEIAGLVNDRIPLTLMGETVKTKVFNSIALCSMATILVAVSFVPSGHGKLALSLLTLAAFTLGFNIGGFYKSGSMIGGPYSPFVMGQISTAMTATMLMVPMIVNPLTPNNTRQEWAMAFYVLGAIMVGCNIFYCFFASAELQLWATAQLYFTSQINFRKSTLRQSAYQHLEISIKHLGLLGAKQAVSFFGTIHWLEGVGNVQQFTLFNFQTKELLMVQESNAQLKFGRYPNGPKKELMAKEMAKDAICLEYRNIAIDIEEIKIDLHMDIWANVFGFLPRPQLAELATQSGSWHFASKIQLFLHEMGEITLGKLHMKSATDGPAVPAIFKANQEMPMTFAPMPINIKNFKEIRLSYQDLDIFIYTFLRDFERNALFTNVNLVFKSVLFSDMSHLSYILPMMTSIESVSIQALNSTDFLKFFYVDLLAELTMPMLTSTRCLYACYDDAYDDAFIRWLHIPRGDGKPRVLVLCFGCNSLIQPFIEHVKKDFLEDKKSVSFFVHICSLHIDNIPPVTTVTVSKIQTHEKLVFTRMHHRCMRIARCPMEATEEWIEEMSKYSRSEYRNIIIDI